MDDYENRVLTRDQEEALDRTLDEWRGIFLRTGLADRETATEALSFLYTCWEKELPRFIFYCSPLEMRGKLLRSTSQLGNSYLSLTQSILFGELPALGGIGSGYVYDRFAVFEDWERVQHSITNEFIRMPFLRPDRYWGQESFGSIQAVSKDVAFHRYMCEHVYDYTEDWPSLRKTWETWKQIKQSAFLFLPYNKVCLVCDSPLYYRLNALDQLHCETGPAVEFEDGSAIYALGGEIVPEFIIEYPELITVQSIDETGNLEIRRIMMERYGFQHYLEDSQAELIDEGQYGTLYRKPDRLFGTLSMIHVRNSTPEGHSRRVYLENGTESVIFEPDLRESGEPVYREFLIGVPPEMES